MAVTVGISLMVAQFSSAAEHAEPGANRTSRIQIAQSVEPMNPLKPTIRNLATGARLYREHCAACHGAKGLGDGPAGKGLSPTPPNLRRYAGGKVETDGFLFWSVSFGGTHMKTAMPAWRRELKRSERWAIILYLRNGLSNSPPK